MGAGRKPGSVVDNHSSRHSVTAMLKQPTRIQREARQQDSYLVLLQVGFTLPRLLPAARCALTTPFHPYLLRRRYTFCCTFRRLAPPRRYLAPCPLEPGLSSRSEPSDCLADSQCKTTARFPSTQATTSIPSLDYKVLT